jgi:hypothetical protein
VQSSQFFGEYCLKIAQGGGANSVALASTGPKTWRWEAAGGKKVGTGGYSVPKASIERITFSSARFLKGRSMTDQKNHK